MSIIISNHYLFQFLSFIYFVPLSITMSDQIQFSFHTGTNIIRCTDRQVQVQQFNSNSDRKRRHLSRCDNIDQLFMPGHTGFEWGTFKIVCTSQSSHVHEEQFIKIVLHVGSSIDKLPELAGQLGYSGQPYELQTEIISANQDQIISVIKSKDQPANNQYYNENTNPKQRRIYIRFKDHPIICRIAFTGQEDNPCSTGDEQYVENVHHTCYYNPGAGKEPTIQELEAVWKQIHNANVPLDNSGTHVLDIEKPDISSFVPSDSNPAGPSNNIPFKPSSNNLAPSKNSIKTQQKSSALMKVGIIIGILLLLGLIGGVGFYMFRKNQSNQSSASSSSLNLQNVTIANDGYTTKNDKLDTELQNFDGNKRPRAGTNMAFNEDM